MLSRDEPIPEETKNETVIEQPDEIVSAPPEQVKPEPKKKEPPIAIDQPVKQNVRQQDKLVKCPQCDKQMKLKSYRYKHELTCKGKLEDIPRKPKAMPKPKAQPIEQEEEAEVIQPKPKLTQPVSNQISNANLQTLLILQVIINFYKSIFTTEEGKV